MVRPGLSAQAMMLAGLLLVSSTANAATPLDELIEPVDGQSACFTRLYDADHLRRHPAQKVRSITVWLQYRKLSPATAVGLDLGIGLNLRGDPLPFFAEGGCNWDKNANRDASGRRLIPVLKKDKAAACIMSAQPDVFEAVSAEEGGFLILDRGRDRDTLMVYLDDSLTMVKRADRSDHHDVKFGPDDRVFLLRRTLMQDCATVQDAVTEPEPGVRRRR